MGIGFFGKLPAAGDFVSRGLQTGLRRDLDAWLTKHIAPIAREARQWPEGGVRSVVELCGAPWLLVIEPSADSVGRVFPLVVCTALNGADRAIADQWADHIWPVLLNVIENSESPDQFFAALGRADPLFAADAPLEPPAIWWDQSAIGDPEEQIARLAQISSG